MFRSSCKALNELNGLDKDNNPIEFEEEEDYDDDDSEDYEDENEDDYDEDDYEEES